VLHRLAEHEALLGRLLEEHGSTSSSVKQVAQAQASAAAEQGLMLQHLDRKMDRALREAARPTLSEHAATFEAHPTSGECGAASAPTDPIDASVPVKRLRPPMLDATTSLDTDTGATEGNFKHLAQYQSVGLYTSRTNSWSDSPMASISTHGRIQLPRGCLRRIVESSRFDMLCAAVIVCNAVTIGIEAQSSMDHALEHTGQQAEWQPQGWLRVLSLSFMTFYALELSAKLLVYRSAYFVGPQWGWNWFDFVLVVTAIYEVVVMLAMNGHGLGDMTWLRLLRLLKSLKMLRVFRLMRFFRELRMIMASLMGSSMALLWSIVMLGLIKFIVGLMFIQCLSSYLLETPLDEIDADTLDNVVTNWFSVTEAIITLFKATTGGNDWADLAQPIRVASASSFNLFYWMFMLYIIFFIVALLNVLTGMFVDAAVKVGDRDNEEMVDLTIQDAYSDDKVGRFKDFVLEKMAEHGTEDGCRFNWDVVSKHRNSEPVKALFQTLQLDFKEARKVFKTLQMVKGAGTLVSVEEFIRVCETKLKNGDVMIASMEHEVKRIGQRIERMTSQLESNSEDVSRLLRRLEDPRAGGAHAGSRTPAKCRAPTACHAPRDTHAPGAMPMP